MITVTYFGSFKELEPTGSEALEWAGGTTEDLLQLLRQRGPDWERTLQPERIYRVALNLQLVHAPATIVDGDEVALLPPVTGG